MAVKGSLTDKVENTIERMETGDRGFTIPWALSFEVSEEGDKYDAFLYVKHPVTPVPFGTSDLAIRRTGPGKTDFEVDLDSVRNYKWSIGKKGYVGANEENIVYIGQINII